MLPVLHSTPERRQSKRPKQDREKMPWICASGEKGEYIVKIVSSVKGETLLLNSHETGGPPVERCQGDSF